MYQVLADRSYELQIPAQPGSDPSRQFAVVLHDFELARYNFKCRLEGDPWNLPLLPEKPDAAQGLPETCKLYENNRVRLNERVANYWFSLLGQLCPEMDFTALVINWKSLTHGSRYITNMQGWNNGYYDPISGENPDAEAMGYEPIVTGGSVVEIIGSLTQKGGVLYYPVRAIDPALSFAGIDPITHPYLFYRPTIIRREVFDDTMREVTRFPQFNGKTITPLFSRGGTNYIDASRVRLLSRGAAFPNPFVPSA